MEQSYETPAPASSEAQSVPSLSLLTFSSVEALRSQQQEVYYRHYDADTGEMSDESLLDEELDKTVEDHLASAHIDESDPLYAVLRRYLDDWSYDNMSNSEWNYGAWENPEADDEDRKLKTGSSGRDRVEQAHQTLFGDASEAQGIDDSTETQSGDVSDGPTECSPEEWEEYADDYEEYANLLTNRDGWATESAKRQSRAFSSNSDEKRNAIKDKYHKSVRAFGITELAGQLTDTDSDAEKNVKVLAWLFDEQAKLRELTTEKLRSTKTSKFVEWMNSGSTAKRIGKSALVGVAASGAAAGISLVAGFGLVAGVAGGATAGAVGFGRFVRGFAKGDRQRGMKTAQEAFIDDDREAEIKDTESDSLDKRFDDAVLDYNEAFEEDTKLEQKKRRKAVMRGLTNVALGVGVGAAVHYASEFFGEADTQSLPDGKDADGDRTPWSDTDADGDGIPNGQDPAPNNPNVDDLMYGRGDLFDGHMGTRSLTPEAVDLMHEQLNGYTVKPGDSVWSLSENFLQEQGIKHPTVYEIDATKDTLLKELRTKGLVDAKGWLSTGDTLRIK